MSKLFRAVTIMIIISTLLAACSSDEPTATSVPPTDVPPTDVPPTATDVPPTEVSPTDVPPTDVPPTATDAPPTDTPPAPTPHRPSVPMGETVATDDGSRIVFISDRDGPREVYVMDASGANQRKVVGPEQDEAVLMWPSWSPDGQSIAYQVMLPPEDASLGDHGGFLMEIWTVAADGSQPTNVSASISDMLLYTPRLPAWSLDGQRLAFLADSAIGEDDLHSTLYVVWADGSGLEQSIPLPWEAYSLTWSPTEDKLLFRSIAEGQEGVYVFSLQDQELVQVYGESRVLVWSPDGQEIIVSSDDTQEILILGADGQLRPLVQFEGRYAANVAWSSDGEHIAVATTNSSELYQATAMHIVAVETGETTLVVDNDDARKPVFSPNWSPDGNRLLYTTIDHSRPGDWPYAPMWIYDVASGQVTQLTPDEGMDGFGSWSPAPQASAANNTWMKTFGGSKDVHCGDVLLADDGGYFIVGTTDVEFEPEMKGDIYLIRTDAAGEVLWDKTYGGPGYERGGTIYPADDGGLMIAGVTTSFGAGGTDAYLIKIDQDGNELWSKTFGGPLDEMGTAWPLPDGGYAVGGSIVDPNDIVVDNPGAAGYGGFAGRSNIYLGRTDNDGNELWTRTFGGADNVMATSAVPTDDGGAVILATIMYYPEGGDDIYLLRVDENGDEVWSYTWDQDSTNAYEVVETSDGGYLISGNYSTSDDRQATDKDYLFIKVDSEGNELWSNIFGDPDMVDYGHVLAATDDGGFVAAGELVKDLYTWDADTALVKIDENGQLLWEKVLDTSTHSMFTTLFQHPDGGYVIAGASFTGRVFNIFLIKTDAEGNVE